MKHLFGPVNSRRLGLSQGIDLLPPKICNFNCIYCEVGPTTLLTCDRKEYVPTTEIITEIKTLLNDTEAVKNIDYFTITATGEPTLHTGIGEVIRFIKNNTGKPVAVLTNGSLLHLKEVRDDLMAADLIIPSLDAALPESYRKINRASPCADLTSIIEGLEVFRKQFKGDIWLEILLAKNMNDSPEDIEAFKKVVKKINPDRIQLNTVARPPLEEFAAPLSQEEMHHIAKQFETPVEIIVDFERRKRDGYRPIIETETLHMLKRRPCTASDICEALNLNPEKINYFLKDMVKTGKIIQKFHNDRTYYQIKK